MYFWNMITQIKQNKTQLLRFVIIVSLGIPIIWLSYQLIFLGKESVTLFIGAPFTLSMLILVYYVGIAVYGIVWILKQVTSLIRLKKELKESELMHLKSQVNPHFFFNMLNNLYGTVEKDPQKAKHLILKLADLMRYGVYESDKANVLLEDEITYIQNYIELHKMRYHKQIDISFEVNSDKTTYEVMPLLFINLVENAFKHGVEALREKAYVKLKLNVKEHVLTFEIENNFDVEEEATNTGIGIENLKRRLALVYPKKHQLKIIKKEGVFNAVLVLQL